MEDTEHTVRTAGTAEKADSMASNNMNSNT